MIFNKLCVFDTMKRKAKGKLPRPTLKKRNYLTPAYYLKSIYNNIETPFYVDEPDFLFHDFIRERQRPPPGFRPPRGSGNLLLRRLNFTVRETPYWEIKSIVSRPPLWEEWELEEDVMQEMMGTDFQQQDEITGHINRNMREIDLPIQYTEGEYEDFDDTEEYFEA